MLRPGSAPGAGRPAEFWEARSANPSTQETEALAAEWTEQEVENHACLRGPASVHSSQSAMRTHTEHRGMPSDAVMGGETWARVQDP